MKTGLNPASHRRPLIAFGVVAAGCVLTLSACTSGSSTSGGGGGGKPVSGGTLHLGILDSPQKLDPIEGTSYPESIIGDNITDKLVWQDPATGKFEPWLATSWKYGKDLTSFTFVLRHGVTFSDGTPFDAQIVKDNFDQRAKGSTELGIAADVAHWAGYDSTTVVDPYTVTVKFTQPNAGFLNIAGFDANNADGFLAGSTLKETAEQRASDPSTIIGTGPFTIKSFTYQKSVVLKKRAGYDWAPPSIAHKGGGPAYVDEVDIETVPEASVRTGSLQSGELDAISDVQPTDEATLKASGFQVLSQRVPGKNIAFELNTSLAPTNDPAVRQALTIGWNRDDLTKSVLTDSYKPASSVLGSKTPGYVDYSRSALKYDPEKAKQVLDAAGWKVGSDGIRVKDGKRLTVKFLGIDNLVVNQPAYQLLQAEVKKVGIDVQLDVLPIADYVVKVKDAKTTYNGVGANISRDDPAVLSQNYSTSVTNAAFLTPGDPVATELDAALQKIQSTLDETARAAAARGAQDLVLSKDFLSDPVYEPAQVVATSSKVHGWRFGATSRSYFYDIWLE